MASLAAPLEAPRFSIGRVFQRAFDTVRRRPAVSIALSILFGAAPGVGLDTWLSQIDQSALVLTIAGHPLPGIVALAFCEMLVGVVFGVVMQGALVALVSAGEGVQRISVVALFGPFARSLLPLAGLGLVTALGFGIGVTLLIVPGLLVYLMWSVAPSALVVEREGLFMALNRSQDLTEGARWKVFGVLLLLDVLSGVLGFVAGFTLALLVGSGVLGAGTISHVLVLGLTRVVSCLAWATVLSSIYVELVRWKEGKGVEALEQVFI